MAGRRHGSPRDTSHGPEPVAAVSAPREFLLTPRHTPKPTPAKKKGKASSPVSKTAAHSAANMQRIPQAHGGALLPGGVPGNQGGGRPPLAFKNFIAQLRQNPNVQQQLENALLDNTSRNYAAALRVIVDYDDELPANITPEQRKARIVEIMREAAKRKAT